MEENPVEGSKNLKLIAIIIVAIVVISSLFYFAIQNTRITAMEGREIADGVALDWNNTAVLVTIHNIGSVGRSGFSSEWRYTYANFTDDINLTRALDVIVSYDGTWAINERERPPTRYAIVNWTYDSDKIVELARDQSEIEYYLLRFPNAKIETMALSCGLDEQHIWYILWSNSGFIDDPHSAVIKLDANTGEILFLETQV